MKTRDSHLPISCLNKGFNLSYLLNIRFALFIAFCVMCLSKPIATYNTATENTIDNLHFKSSKFLSEIKQNFVTGKNGYSNYQTRYDDLLKSKSVFDFIKEKKQSSPGRRNQAFGYKVTQYIESL